MSTTPNAPPSSWPMFWWRVIRDPKAVLTVLLVATAVYVGLRIAGYDIVPPLLARLGVSTIARNLDISGEWEYRCTVIGSPFYEWGGIATIRQEATPYGIQWKLFGQRLWDTKSDESGNRISRDLPTPVPWETNWGIVTSEPAVRYAYRITNEEGTIEGYAYGDIAGSTGRPDQLTGKFYQLPPYKALHGRMEFRRIVNHTDKSKLRHPEEK